MRAKVERPQDGLFLDRTSNRAATFWVMASNAASPGFRSSFSCEAFKRDFLSCYEKADLSKVPIPLLDISFSFANGSWNVVILPAIVRRWPVL